MAKIIAFSFVVLLAACGRSECADYCTVGCAKYSTCVEPVGNVRACEEECTRLNEAARRTEATCKKAREGVQAMTCAEYRAFIAQNAR